MRGPREPFLSGCCVCGKQYLGNAGDPCPSCGGDVDVAAFKRAIDYKALAADLQQRLAGAKADIAVLQSYDAARESAPSPKCGDDPVLIANRWNGYEGTREPDFDASAEGTASFLAGAVLDMSKQLAARTAELIAMTAARDEARRIGDAALDIELRLHNEQLTKLAAERDADWSAFPWLRKKAKP